MLGIRTGLGPDNVIVDVEVKTFKKVFVSKLVRVVFDPKVTKAVTEYVQNPHVAGSVAIRISRFTVTVS